jgi:hypothetical protein
MMANRRSSRLSPRCHVLLVVLIMTALPVELLVHSISAVRYYIRSSQQLRLAASMAVAAGARYLPMDPEGAIRTADRSVQHYGVISSEIVSTEVSADDSMLTIRLSRRIPKYVALFALGLPSRSVNVTASGRRHVPALTVEDSWFRRENSARPLDKRSGQVHAGGRNGIYLETFRRFQEACGATCQTLSSVHYRTHFQHILGAPFLAFDPEAPLATRSEQSLCGHTAPLTSDSAFASISRWAVFFSATLW